MKDIKLRILTDLRTDKLTPPTLIGNMSGRDILYETSLNVFTIVSTHTVLNGSYGQILTLRYYPLVEPSEYYACYHGGLKYAPVEGFKASFYFQDSFSENGISCWLDPSILNKSLVITYSKPEYNIFPNDLHIYNYRLDIEVGLNSNNTLQLGDLPGGDLLYLGLPRLCQEPIRCDFILISSDPDVYTSIKYNDYYSPQIGFSYTGGTGGTGGIGGTGGCGIVIPDEENGNSGLIVDQPTSKLQYSNRTGGTGSIGGYGIILS